MTQKNKPLLLTRSTQFKRDLKKAIRQKKNLDLLENIITLLQHQQELPTKNRDYSLGGNWNGYRECHIEPDWLLIYRVNEEELLLYLMRLGSHAELFKK